MINNSKAITDFAGLVGYENPTIPQYQLVDTDMSKSDSGLYYTDNPLVKIPFIYDTQDHVDIDNEDFNTYLKGIHNRAVTGILRKVFNKPDFIDRSPFFRYANNKVETESLPEGFKGYKIVPTGKNIAFKISRIILEFDKEVTFTLYLFNSAIDQAIESKEITATAGQHIETLDWTVDNTGDYFMGEFYLGYYSNDPEPYARDYELSDLLSEIKGIYIERVNYPDATSGLPNLNNEKSSSLCFGLNPDITTYNDYTDQAIQNKGLFARAIQMQGQIDILSSYIATSRTNRSTRITQDIINRATVELEGRDAEGITMVGLKDKLKGEINHITKEIERIRGNYYPKGLKVVTGV